jgi:hypothetical protein
VPSLGAWPLAPALAGLATESGSNRHPDRYHPRRQTQIAITFC